MNRLFAILTVSTLFAAGCSQEEDILPTQQTRTVSFLTSTHSPRLVAEADLEEDSQLPFYTVSGNSVYRYVEDFYDPDRANRAEVTATSKVTITFRAYVFSYAAITTSGQSITMPYYSNDPALETLYEEAGLTQGAWTFEPYAVDMRKQDILKGLYLALLGCRQGDRVEAYMTYNMAYGDQHLSVVLRESPLAIFFTVDTVE